MLTTRNIKLLYDAELSPHLHEAIAKYAEGLKEQGLPVILSAEHLALLVGVDGRYLFGVSNNARSYYRRFRLPKKGASFRVISEPLPLLKLIQRWILDEVLSRAVLQKCANAYISGRSIKSNARLHIGQEKLLKLDVEDFFGSLRIDKVYSVFLDFGYTSAVSTALAHLCCLDGRLPQGAPTSGALSNLILRPADDAILNFCLQRKIRYTRYADDMCFSGADFDVSDLIVFVEKQMGLLSLKLNAAKTKLTRQSHRQVVTGIVVNKKLTVPRDRRKRIRQEIFYIKKYGLAGHSLRVEESEPIRLLRRLIGECTFLNHVHSQNVIDDEDINILRALLKEERQLRREVVDPFLT
jgi:RNA-directed DNA polymerase